MKLIRCDHCRRELAVGAGPGEALKELTGYEIVTVGGTPFTGGGKSYELCAACAREVTRWITTPVPKEGTP